MKIKFYKTVNGERGVLLDTIRWKNGSYDLFVNIDSENNSQLFSPFLEELKIKYPKLNWNWLDGNCEVQIWPLEILEPAAPADLSDDKFFQKFLRIKCNANLEH